MWATLVLALALAGALALVLWLRRRGKEGYTFSVNTSWGGKRKCKNGHHFMFRKKQKNGRCKSGYKDSQNGKYRTCYRCATDKEQQDAGKELKDWVDSLPSGVQGVVDSKPEPDWTDPKNWL